MIDAQCERLAYLIKSGQSTEASRAVLYCLQQTLRALEQSSRAFEREAKRTQDVRQAQDDWRRVSKQVPTSSGASSDDALAFKELKRSVSPF